VTGVVVLLSGGLDSAVVLHREIVNRGVGHVYALGVDYGQRHRKELAYAEDMCWRLGVQWRQTQVVLPFSCALTSTLSPLPETPAQEVDATYVPGRNTVLVALAAAYAQAVGADTVLIGCNADDAAGYPDCRPEWVDAADRVLQGTYGLRLYAPLVTCSKAAVIAMAGELGIDLRTTWSCYYGGITPCGHCGACVLRQRVTA
jgi:7-cyano-7-deazaguanine synthase